MASPRALLLVPALLLGITAAFAQTVAIAPPPPRAEVVPAAPAPHWYWVSGHWNWNGARYVWMKGRWIEPRPNQIYVQAYWRHEGGRWVFHPGHWEAMRSALGVAAVSVPVAPPPPRAEMITPAPGPSYFWVNGHWRWDNGQHIWVPGHWEASRASEIWVPAQWVQRGGGWIYVGGHWQPR